MYVGFRGLQTRFRCYPATPISFRSGQPLLMLPKFCTEHVQYAKWIPVVYQRGRRYKKMQNRIIYMFNIMNIK